MALIHNFGKRLCSKPTLQKARANSLVRIAFDPEYHLKVVAHRTENSTVQMVTGKDILLEFNCDRVGLDESLGFSTIADGRIRRLALDNTGIPTGQTTLFSDSDLDKIYRNYPWLHEWLVKLNPFKTHEFPRSHVAMENDIAYKNISTKIAQFFRAYGITDVKPKWFMREYPNPVVALDEGKWDDFFKLPIDSYRECLGQGNAGNKTVLWYGINPETGKAVKLPFTPYINLYDEDNKIIPGSKGIPDHDKYDKFIRIQIRIMPTPTGSMTYGEDLSLISKN